MMVAREALGRRIPSMGVGATVGSMEEMLLVMLFLARDRRIRCAGEHGAGCA